MKSIALNIFTHETRWNRSWTRHSKRRSESLTTSLSSLSVALINQFIFTHWINSPKTSFSWLVLRAWHLNEVAVQTEIVANAEQELNCYWNFCAHIKFQEKCESTCFAILCLRPCGSKDNFWRCRSRCRTTSVAYLALPLSIAQSVERSCTVVSPFLNLLLMLMVQWIPEKKNNNRINSLLKGLSRDFLPCRWSYDCCAHYFVESRSHDSYCDAG